MVFTFFLILKFSKSFAFYILLLIYFEFNFVYRIRSSTLFPFSVKKKFHHHLFLFSFLMFIKIALIILGTSHLHINFTTLLSRSRGKKPASNLARNCTMNDFGKSDIFIIFLYHEHGISLLPCKFTIWFYYCLYKQLAHIFR